MGDISHLTFLTLLVIIYGFNEQFLRALYYMSFFIAHCAKKIKFFDLFTRGDWQHLTTSKYARHFFPPDIEEINMQLCDRHDDERDCADKSEFVIKSVQNLYTPNFSQDHMTRPPIHTYIYGCVLVYVHVTSDFLFIIWLMYRFGLYTN